MLHKSLLYSLVCYFICIFLTGCDLLQPAPGVVTLLSPTDNSICLKGSLISSDTASVAFVWSSATYADSYQLKIENLNTHELFVYKTSELSYTVNLSSGTPFAWYVVSVNSASETTSSKWKFFLAGSGSISYAPFPATLLSPASGITINSNGANSAQVTFQWSGSDVDNDIASYSVYLDNTNATTQVVNSQTETTITKTLQSGKTYYWKVLTTDKAGNTSFSEIYSFIIN